MSKDVTMLIIMDGFGINPNKEGNAVANAKKPNLDRLAATCPMSKAPTPVDNDQLKDLGIEVTEYESEENK